MENAEVETGLETTFPPSLQGLAAITAMWAGSRNKWKGSDMNSLGRNPVLAAALALGGTWLSVAGGEACCGHT